jgi:hypothetical protein
MTTRPGGPNKRAAPSSPVKRRTARKAAAKPKTKPKGKTCAGADRKRAPRKGEGRPSKYLPDYARQARELCLMGATEMDLQRFFGVSPNTLYNWRAAHPEFLSAINEAKSAVDDGIVERRLFERATGYKHRAVKIMMSDGVPIEHEYVEHYPPDTTAAIFWLKNRQPEKWRDKQEHDHGISDDLAQALGLVDGRTKALNGHANGVAAAEDEPAA